jgi:hypothetical protein
MVRTLPLMKRSVASYLTLLSAKAGALAVHVHGVAVQVGLRRQRVAQHRLGAASDGALRVWRAAASRMQRAREVEVARHVARRVGVGDVAGDQPLALGAQRQGLGLEVEHAGHALDHAEPSGWQRRPTSPCRRIVGSRRQRIGPNSAALPPLFAPRGCGLPPTVVP